MRTVPPRGNGVPKGPGKRWCCSRVLQVVTPLKTCDGRPTPDAPPVNVDAVRCALSAASKALAPIRLAVSLVNEGANLSPAGPRLRSTVPVLVRPRDLLACAASFKGYRAALARWRWPPLFNAEHEPWSRNGGSLRRNGTARCPSCLSGDVPEWSETHRRKGCQLNLEKEPEAAQHKTAATATAFHQGTTAVPLLGIDSPGRPRSAPAISRNRLLTR
jgi:hypothetical protein